MSRIKRFKGVMSNVLEEERNRNMGLENLPVTTINDDIWVDLDKIEFFHKDYDADKIPIEGYSILYMSNGSVLTIEIESESLAVLIHGKKN